MLGGRGLLSLWSQWSHSWHEVSSVEDSKVSNDFRDHTPKAISDGHNTSPIELGWLDVQHVVDPSIRHAALEDIQSCEFAGFLDSKATLHQQLQQRPVPEGVRFDQSFREKWQSIRCGYCVRLANDGTRKIAGWASLARDREFSPSCGSRSLYSGFFEPNRRAGRSAVEGRHAVQAV